MKKQAIFISFLCLIFLIAFFVGISTNKEEKHNVGAINITNTIEERTNTNEIAETSAVEEKTTPNTVLTLKKHYTICDHIISDIVAIPEDMVNLNEEEIEEIYPGWIVEEFSKDEVILCKEIDDFCDEHFLLKEEDGYINIYKINKDGKETLKEKTDLSIEYLTETDKITLKNGIKVYGTEELNKIIEDFE